MKMMGFRVFQIMNLESCQFKMKQNNPTVILRYSFHNTYNQDGPPDPHRPQIRLSSKFQNFKDSEFQNVLIYVDPILSKKIHVFWEILIPYSRFPRVVQTDRLDRSVPVSSKRLCSISEILRLPKIINGNVSGLLMICLRYPTVSKEKYYQFWG